MYTLFIIRHAAVLRINQSHSNSCSLVKWCWYPQIWLFHGTQRVTQRYRSISRMQHYLPSSGHCLHVTTISHIPDIKGYEVRWLDSRAFFTKIKIIIIHKCIIVWREQGRTFCMYVWHKIKTTFKNILPIVKHGGGNDLDCGSS